MKHLLILLAVALFTMAPVSAQAIPAETVTTNTGIELNVAFLVGAAVIVIGMIQWAKGIANKVPSKAWAIIMPILSVVVAICVGGGINQIAVNGLGIWAICQLGYEIIVQAVTKRLRDFILPEGA